LGGLFSGIRGLFGVEVERGRLQRSSEARQAFLRLIWARRLLPPPILHLFLRLKVSIPGIVRVPKKVIIVPGDLREMIQNVSSGWGMGLGSGFPYQVRDRVWFNEPQPHVFQDGLDDLWVFVEADDPHGSPTLRASQGIDLVDFLNESGPVLPIFLRTLIRF
jgi:hypothetical protein